MKGHTMIIVVTILAVGFGLAALTWNTTGASTNCGLLDTLLGKCGNA